LRDDLNVDEPSGPRVHRPPSVIVFDVNETLSDMASMGTRFEDVGAPAAMAQVWFAGLLRDGFALSTAGASAPFADIAAERLRVTFHGLGLDLDLDAAVGHVTDGFGALPVHPDVPDGVRALAQRGIRLVTLSNGSTSVAQGLFERAGISQYFERLLSVEDAGIWKPAAASYAYALEQCGVPAWDAMLVAVHPWDIDGAGRAGLATAWVNRSGGTYPAYFRGADLEVSSLTDLAAGPLV
jgi:2-haloacid dehalogenase